MINPVLFLLLVIGMQWFPVSADQGGNVSMSYYCKNPGCAADVTEVFCHDNDPVFDNGPIPDCAGHLPAPNSTPQRKWDPSQKRRNPLKGKELTSTIICNMLMSDDSELAKKRVYPLKILKCEGNSGLSQEITSNNMITDPVLFLLLVIGMQWFPVSADQGGHVSMSYYCKNPGCAADVTEVFCHDDDPVFDNGPIPDCAGHLPAPNSVCQHHGRAFVTTDRAEQCDFEGKEGHIDSEECTVHSVICNITKEKEGSTERQRTGGHVSMSYYCKNPGCAADVTKVFCHDDDPVFDNGPIPDCAGHLPAPNSVCQHHGRAFVTTDRAEQCDFEGKEGHIDSEECTVHSVICNITKDTTKEVGSITEEEESTERQRTVLIVLAILFFLGLLFLFVRFCKRRQNTEQNQQDGRASGTAQHLMDMQSPGTARILLDWMMEALLLSVTVDPECRCMLYGSLDCG
ncbi:hypothetical protein INR49_006136 [Caranx melampygus]|nr:hypothetical protein INR49_006136 [Caranx melampygus]